MFKKYWPYILIFCSLFLVLTFFTGRKKQDVKWIKTYKQQDKIPFGTSAVYQLLSESFFKDKIKIKKLPILQSPGIKNISHVSYCFVNDQLGFDQYETKKLLAFIRNGNKVFLSANFFTGMLKDSFKIETKADLPYIDENTGKLDSLDKRTFGIQFLNPYLKNDNKFIYDRLLGYATFSSFDSTRMSAVAADDSGRVVCLHTKLGKGDLYFFSLPDVFTNFYIVNHPSRFFAYRLCGVLENNQIWWDEYYKSVNGPEQNPFRFMIENDSLYYAFWMAILATLFFMFFGMRRTQRAIPVLEPKSNTTLQFVEVVGNVYFSTENHKIIAEEKIALFFELLRSRFQIRSSVISEEDIIRISRLSGVEVGKIRELIANIQYIYSTEVLSEKELLSFNKRMEEFYKNNQR